MHKAVVYFKVQRRNDNEGKGIFPNILFFISLLFFGGTCHDCHVYVCRRKTELQTNKTTHWLILRLHVLHVVRGKKDTVIPGIIGKRPLKSKGKNRCVLMAAGA